MPWWLAAPLLSGSTAELMLNVWLPTTLLLTQEQNTGQLRSRHLCGYLYLWVHLHALAHLVPWLSVPTVAVALALWTSLYYYPSLVRDLSRALHDWQAVHLRQVVDYLVPVWRWIPQALHQPASLGSESILTSAWTVAHWAGSTSPSGRTASRKGSRT